MKSRHRNRFYFRNNGCYGGLYYNRDYGRATACFNMQGYKHRNELPATTGRCCECSDTASDNNYYSNHNDKIHRYSEGIVRCTGLVRVAFMFF